MRLQMAELGVPVISVTHDVEEALMLGAEVVRIEDGRVVAEGPAAEVLAAERERILGVLQGSR
jgi:molybdate transport system ATP-binding protein